MSAEQTGLRVQECLDQLAGAGQGEAAEELVRLLMDFYTGGLERMAAFLPPQALGEPLVSGLLVLHDLHPESVETRIGRALENETGWQVEEFDAATGSLRLRGEDSGGGCGCGGAQAEERLEEALACFAPEVTALHLERRPALLQIGTRPVAVER
ncbi:thioredoxin [Kitasatospora sp. NE20-6]|uniref:hypothetical protein n=1 Tax=Kitasatospora sp. NE20-6 TaxID=2859066 RepID=UPI0034DC06BC